MEIAAKKGLGREVDRLLALLMEDGAEADDLDDEEEGSDDEEEWASEEEEEEEEEELRAMAAASMSGRSQGRGSGPSHAGGSAAGVPDAVLVRQWMEAAKSGNAEALQQLLVLNAGLLECRGPGLGMTALHWAAARGHVACIEMLLGRGCSPFVANAEVGCCTRASRALREREEHPLADRPTKDDPKQGSTPLHSACGNGQVEAARLLLRAVGADAGGYIRRTNADGRTARQGHCVLRLLRA